MTKIEQWIKQQHFPKNDLEKQLILKKIMEEFEPGMIYIEDEVNLIIKEFYEDFSTIRRELINFRYMQRDPRKGTYWVLKKELSNEDLKKIEQLQKGL